MMIQVNGYALSWDIRANKGSLFIHLVNGQQGQIEVDSATELSALADVLRASSTVFLDQTTQVLSTPIKPPGTA